jgi:hypothetical protein
MLKFIALCATVILGQVSAQNTEKQSNNSEKNNYSTADFSIDFPGDWQLNNSGSMGTTVISLSPQQENDSFLENFNIIVMPIEKGTTLKGLTDTALAMIGKVMNEFEFVERKTMQINGKECAKITYIFKQGLFKLKTNQYIFLKDKSAYLITATFLTTTYNDYISINDDVINTFKLK